MHYFYYIILLLFLNLSAFSQALTANAGSNKTICYGQVTILGGSPSATGGTAPYTYDWQPAGNVSNSTVSNPAAQGLTQGTYFRLIVTDKNGAIDTSDVYIDVDQIYTFNAGVDTGYCFGQELGVKIGAPNNNNTNHTFSWIPAVGLDDPSAANPIASPTVQTKYTLIVSDGKCPNNTSYVNVTPFAAPTVDAGLDSTIKEGQTITLNGIGSNIINWAPSYNIKYINTATPDVWPIKDTTYYIYTEDSHGCSAIDSVKISVLKSDSLFFYSAFTPNSDGDNDLFYIANLEKFPDNNLKIYNRYGKIVFSATNYANDWDGTYLGNKVPEGVYYYILFDGIDKKYKGSVTILR